jgi:hypothetical protein
VSAIEGLHSLQKIQISNNICGIHAAEPTMHKWFVSGHDFGRADKLLVSWASAPAGSVPYKSLTSCKASLPVIVSGNFSATCSVVPQ